MGKVFKISNIYIKSFKNKMNFINVLWIEYFKQMRLFHAIAYYKLITIINLYHNYSIKILHKCAFWY